jgi:hypothetical protein
LSVVIEVVHQFVVVLATVAGLKHLPRSLGLRLAQTVVHNVAADQHDALVEKQLREEREHHVRMRV